jgi:hypothetical protein
MNQCQLKIHLSTRHPQPLFSHPQVTAIGAIVNEKPLVSESFTAMLNGFVGVRLSVRGRWPEILPRQSAERVNLLVLPRFVTL